MIVGYLDLEDELDLDLDRDLDLKYDELKSNVYRYTKQLWLRLLKIDSFTIKYVNKLWNLCQCWVNQIQLYGFYH